MFCSLLKMLFGDTIHRMEETNKHHHYQYNIIIIVIVFASIGNVRASDVLYFILLIHRPIKSNDYHGMCE